ncbi:DUF4253 domain-containing protein [Streptomyces gamaensis]|uniref:DUF4253 domain-containing protein n=1 Tax=Streptomyces gamaensis TaxID=1763542 RepID=A0ABW0Z5D0_9ACTN
MSSPDDHKPADVLEEWWERYAADEVPSDIAPFGRAWPDLAPGIRPDIDPDRAAVDYARDFLSRRPHARLGLVAAASGAYALTTAGWSGPMNHENDTARFSAVVRDWEEHFGARVVAVGFDTLYLSVAAPPLSAGDALLLAAEHFAFCPDTLWQSCHTLADHAGRLMGAGHWEFWWD